jgi:hypothetical protein
VIENSVRRVITGETAARKSVIVADERLGCKQTAGINVYQVWGVGNIPVPFPTEGGDRSVAVSGGVVRTAVGVIPPGVLVGSDDQAHLHFDAQGFHQTESVDVAFVASGEIVMRVPGEPAVHLKAGDCVVQNGALHSWTNEGAEPVVIFWTWIKAARS